MLLRRPTRGQGPCGPGVRQSRACSVPTGAAQEVREGNAFLNIYVCICVRVHNTELVLLLCRCQQSKNVVYTPSLVESISSQNENLKLISVRDSTETWFAGMIIVAAGGMGGQKFIQYEQSSWPHVGAQTAYGIECEVGKLI